MRTDARLEGKAQRNGEKQNCGSRDDGEKYLSLQHGEEPDRKVLRAHPGALPEARVDAGGVLPGVVV